jgi:tetratricopeptide (TPR) repeat protein
MSRKARVAQLLILGLTLSWPVKLCAEERSASQEAIRLGYEGLALYQEGRWAEALAHFTQANITAHSPVFVLYMARCQRNVHRLLEAAAELEKLLKADRQVGAPSSWENALRDARAELEALRGRIPSVRIRGHGAASATIDAKPVALDALVQLDPGKHIVRAWSADGRFMARSIELGEGRQGVDVVLSFEVPAPLPPAKAVALPLAPPVANPTQPWRTSAWITGAAALGSALLGSGLGLLAKSRLDAVRQNCDGSRCPGALEHDAREARRLANLSTVAFGLAGINATFCLTFALVGEGHSIPKRQD